MANTALMVMLSGLVPAGADRLRVEVVGVGDELRENVLGTLSIDDRREEVDEAQVRHLHERAPGEIERSLQPFGFYRAEVRATLEREGRTWVARYSVDPGPAVVLDTVDVRVTGDGTDDPEFRRLVARFPLRVGDPLHHALYLRGKEAFVQQSSRAGYLDARFDVAQALVDLDRYAATIRLHYDTGPRFRFGDVRLEQHVLDPELARAFVRIPRGEPFDYARLLRVQETLLGSPYFKGVEIVPRRDLAEGLEVPIEVKLVPGEPRHLVWGLGYGTDEGLSARIGFEARRLNRAGHRLGIDGTFSEIQRSAAARYHIPWKDPRTDELTLAGGWSLERPAPTRSRRIVANASLRRLLGDWTRTLSLGFEHDRFRVGPEERTSRFLSPAMLWSFLRADSRIFTSRGRRVDVDSRGAAEQLLADASFVRLDARAKWVETPLHRTRLIARGEAGTTWASDFDPLSPTLRFFAGGAQSVRGFEYNALGPRDSTGAVIGGPHLLVGSLEVDHRLFERWLVAAFYDIGSALFRRGDPVEDAAGIGIRWLSPVGPVRADAAVPLHEPGRKVRFHLTLGPDL